MVLSEIKHKQFTILIETEGNDDYQLYIYQTKDGELEVLILHQEYEQDLHSKEEVLSIGVSYIHSILGETYVNQ